jgi:alpha-ketoglutarate-dependent taurine dioxygenase
MEGDGDQRLRRLFGVEVQTEGPLSRSGAGLRIKGVDLREPLSPDQVSVLLDTLSNWRIVTISGQDLNSFTLAHFERFANHWGAPLPHPSNFKRRDSSVPPHSWSKDVPELLPREQQFSSQVNSAFPGELQCLDNADSPAVLVLGNMGRLTDKEREAGPTTTRGTTWHTDIEHHPIPLYISMFVVHKVPVSRDAPGGTWVVNPELDDPQTFPYFEDSDSELMRLRRDLPLNGETAFADTAAAFSSLLGKEQERLLKIKVRRRSYAGAEGQLAPLVRTDPRSGLKSLHSPLWCARPPNQAPVEVEGMSKEASRAFLDEIEAHVLQPEFRYDHLHTPGDVTLWHDFMTLHIAPPLKENIQSLDDARLFYRISCKGEPALTLPRRDPSEWLRANITLGYETPAEIIEAR